LRTRNEQPSLWESLLHEVCCSSGLLAEPIGKMSRIVRRVKNAGGATLTVFRDRSRAARRRVQVLASKLLLRRKLAELRPSRPSCAQR
jgi:hypothetical protein